MGVGMSTQTQLIEQVIEQQASQMKYHMENQDDQNQRLMALEVGLTDLTKSIKGNGQPGLLDRFNIVEQTQSHCVASRKGLRSDWKWIATGLLAVIAVLKEYIK